MPSRANTRVQGADVLAYLANDADEAVVALTIEKTFLSPCRSLAVVYPLCCSHERSG